MTPAQPTRPPTHAQGPAPGEGLPLLYSVRDLAKIFRVSEAAIRKRIRLRQLGPVIRVGKGYLMRASALERFLEEHEDPGAGIPTTRQ